MLDGEVLSLRSDGRPEAFQVVASRTMSSVDVAALTQTGPLQVFFLTCCMSTAETYWTRHCRSGWN